MKRWKEKGKERGIRGKEKGEDMVEWGRGRGWELKIP